MTTVDRTLEESASMVIKFLVEKKIIPARSSPVTAVKELFVPEKRIATAKAEADLLPALDITEIDVQWLQILSEGWAAPLTGFMREDQLLQVSTTS